MVTQLAVVGVLNLELYASGVLSPSSSVQQVFIGFPHVQKTPGLLGYKDQRKNLPCSLHRPAQRGATACKRRIETAIQGGACADSEGDPRRFPQEVA